MARQFSDRLANYEERFGENVLIVGPADPEEELLARAREGDAQGRLFDDRVPAP